MSINFISELFILIGLAQNYFLIVSIGVLNIFGSTVYSIWLLTRILYGSSKNIIFYKDLDRIEFISCFLLTYCIIILGIFPANILNTIKGDVIYISV